MIFKVGDRVEVIGGDTKTEFVGFTGTIERVDTHLYEHRSIYQVGLDQSFPIPDWVERNAQIKSIYGKTFWPEELKASDTRASVPKKKRKWYQWGTTPYKSDPYKENS